MKKKINDTNHFTISLLPWRNWLARSAVNRKVGGSSPPKSEFFRFNYVFDENLNEI